MNVDFLKDLKYKDFILCNPNGDEIAIFKHYSENLTINFNDLWELSFEVNNVDNKYFTLFIKDRVVKIEGFGNFIIDDCKEKDNGNSKIKFISCKSQEYQLAKKVINYLPLKAYKFYDALPQNIADTFMGIVLSYLPNWSIGEIDLELYGKYRIFDITSDVNIYNLLIDQAQSSYECIFKFDTLNHTISAYTREHVIKDTDIIVSFENLMNSVEIQPISEGLCTALSVRGANDLRINLVNPLGTSIIYNLDNIIDEVDKDTNIRLMTLETSNAWKAWKVKFENAKTAYTNAIVNLKNANKELLQKLSQLQNINAEIKALTASISAYTTLDEDKTALVLERDEKIAQAKAISNDIDQINDDIDRIEEELKNINTALRFENSFTTEQIKELEAFIIIGEYNDEHFAITDSMTDNEIIDMTQELYDKAVRELNILSNKRYSFNIDMACPFFTDNFKMFKRQFELGSQIELRDSKDNKYFPILISVSVDYDNLDNINFTFSESMKNINGEFKLSQLFGKTISTATNLILNNMKYNAYVDSGDKQTLRKMRTEAINTDMQNITNNESSVLIDDFGILCRGVDANGVGGYSPNQSRLNDIGLIFTKDYWKHAEAVFGNITLPNGQKAYGLNAQALVSDITITDTLVISNANNSVVIDENGATFVDCDISMTTTNGKNKILLSPTNGFRIQSKNGATWDDVFYIDTDGNLVSKSKITGGSININNKFKVNTDGTVEMATGTLNSFKSLMNDGKGLKVTNGKVVIDGDLELSGNIKLGGNITWFGNNDKPVVYQYSVNGTSGWHSTEATTDYWRRESWNGGTTWGVGYQYRGVNGANGRDGRDGSDASVTWANVRNALQRADATQSTFITADATGSPNIYGGKIYGAEIYAGGNSVNGGTYIKLSNDGFNLFNKNGKRVFTIRNNDKRTYMTGNGSILGFSELLVSFYSCGEVDFTKVKVSFLNSEVDFTGATVTGLNATGGGTAVFG